MRPSKESRTLTLKGVIVRGNTVYYEGTEDSIVWQLEQLRTSAIKLEPEEAEKRLSNITADIWDRLFQ